MPPPTTPPMMPPAAPTPLSAPEAAPPSAPAARARRLFHLVRPIGWDGGLAVSPDGRSLVYAQLDRIGCDIFLMRHWR